MGTPSFNGMVFKSLDHPGMLVKITLTSPRLFASEVRGFETAHKNGNPIKVHYHKSVTVGDEVDFRLKRLFRAYNGGDAFIGVMVMDDFFVGAKEKGDLNDFVKKHPQFRKQMMTLVHTMMNQIKVKHGDLHPGNILYRVLPNDDVQIGIIDFGYSYDGNISNVTGRTFTNSMGRPTFVNRNHPLVHRVENKWYLNHWYAV